MRRTGQTIKIDGGIDDATTPAFIYARVSSKEQEEGGFSIPAQIGFLREHAQKHGMTVIREVEEACTAKESGRPEFNAILKDARAMLTARKGKPVALVVEKMDRLTRNFLDFISISDLIKEGLSIHFVRQGGVWDAQSRSSDNFMNGLMLLQARNYIENLSEEVRKGQREKANRGLWPSVAPIGFTNNRIEKTIEHHPDEAPAIRTLFEWAATGRYTLAALSKMAFEEGLKSRRARKQISKYGIYRILTNPIYYGPFKWKHIGAEGIHAPIITKERFDEVQAALDKKAKPHLNRRDFMFTGMLTCLACGCAITGQMQKKRLIYYRCTEGRGECKAAAYLREEALLDQVGEALKKLRIADDVVEYIRKKLLKAHAGRAKEQEATLIRLQTRYTKLGDMKAGAFREKLEGNVATEDFLRTKAEIEAEMVQIETRMASLRRTDAKAMVEGVKIIDAVRHAYEAFMGATQLERRKILDFLLSNAQLDGKKAVLTWKSPFHWMAEGASLDEWRS